MLSSHLSILNRLSWYRTVPATVIPYSGTEGVAAGGGRPAGYFIYLIGFPVMPVSLNAPRSSGVRRSSLLMKITGVTLEGNMQIQLT